MLPLSGTVQPYAWGSPTFLAALQRREPTGGPEAELWLGAHPVAPSTVVDRGRAVSLTALIEDDPGGTLGAAAARFASLPFLLKVLAAAEPLSLQAHPSAEQAAAGYAREDAARIPRDAPHRSFRDPSAKPELVCALTPFEALCGFRPLAGTLDLLDTLGVAALAPVAADLRVRGADALAGIVGRLLLAPREETIGLVDAVAAACAGATGAFAAEAGWAVRLATAYPGDPGVVIALLLNLVTLAPGEALFLGPGNLHAYLRGAAVEIMASSDNVLRGGLTPKHVDVPTLLEVVDTAPGRPEVQRPHGAVHTYRCPVPEFGLTRAVLDAVGPLPCEVAGPEVLLVVDGEVLAVPSSGEVLRLRSGDAAFVPASDGAYTLSGAGTAFRATLGDHPGIVARGV